VKRLKLEDFAPLSGVASVVLLAVAVILFGAFDYFPTPDRTVEILTKAADSYFAIGVFGLYASLALMWFSASLFAWLKQHESGSGRLAATAMAGGIACGAGFMGGFGILYTAAGHVARVGSLDPSSAWVMYSLYSDLMGLVHALVLMIGATGLVALRTKAFPAWFGWASVVIAVGMVTPFDFIFEGIALVWLVVASLWIFFRRARETPAVAAGV
jgi:hypothetical protein